jgi:protein arginine N-methyltransferase 1
MDLARQIRPRLQAIADRAISAGVNWAKDTRLGYKLRNRRDFGSMVFHEVMLADRARVDAYAQALPRLVRPGSTVVDLGTGTGILGFLAARAGAGTVHAIDHSPIIEAAREVAAKNGLNNVVFHEVNSKAFDLAEKADLLVHEQIGSYLFEERMVSNIADLRDRVLRPGAPIVPGTFDFFVEPCSLKEPFVIPFAWQQNIEGIDFSVLRARCEAQPPQYRRLELPPDQFDRPMATPEPVLHVDLQTASPGDLPHVLEFDRVVESAGPVHGLGVWLVAHLDDQATIDTTPFGLPNSSWRIPLLRLESPIEVIPGDRLRIRLEAEQLEVPDTWTWSVRQIRDEV